MVRGFESRPLRHSSAILLAFLAAGCRAERTLTITTDPPGAQVRLNETELGPSPIRHEFDHYGTWRVTAHEDGHHTVSRRIEVDGPWYATFPLDLVSEVLLPIGWQDHHYVHLELPQAAGGARLPDLESVLLRAEALRRAGPDGPRELPPVRMAETTEAPLDEPDEP